MRAAPFYPGQKMSTTFVAAVDDTSLYFDINELTPKQMQDDACLSRPFTLNDRQSLKGIYGKTY